MRSFKLLALLILVSSVSSNEVDAQYSCDECAGASRSSGPFLRFLDDFHSFPHGMGSRNPYEERIETERHDFTQSTKTVGRGVVQIESGYSLFYKDKNEEIEQTHTLPETLLRWGISDDIEFRLRWTYLWRFFDSEENVNGAQDLIWSIKLGMTEECGWIPESALEIRSAVPTGGDDFTLGRVEVGFDLIYAWELAPGWEFYGSTGYIPGGLGDIGLIPDEPQVDDFEAWSQSFALGIELSEKVTMYNEWYGIYSYALEDNFSVNVYNIGVDYYISDDFVLDFRAGVGLTSDADDFFTGIGGGYRF